jgi:hypothetical protein
LTAVSGVEQVADARVNGVPGAAAKMIAVQLSAGEVQVIRISR